MKQLLINVAYKNTHLSASDFGPLIDRNDTFVSNFQKKNLKLWDKNDFSHSLIELKLTMLKPLHEKK